MSDDTKKEKIIGIDLGTSNSAASVLIKSIKPYKSNHLFLAFSTFLAIV